MYKLEVKDTPIITVYTARDTVSYSVNGTKMNPLEAFYCSLAGCAGVYAKKACGELGISAEGIEIECIPKAGSAGALSLSKFTTNVKFPVRFSEEEKSKIIDSIKHCAVKEIVILGSEINFEVISN